MRLLFFFIFTLLVCHVGAKNYDNPDTLVVARDGTGEFRNISEAIEVCRAFMEYHKVIYIKKGTYKEKLIIPQSLTNIELCGEDRDQTIITWDDHANISMGDRCWVTGDSQQPMANSQKPMGTFRTFTLKIEGSRITLKNLTVENNAARLGQAVALHTEGDRLTFVNCRFLGHQDTIYTGNAKTRLYFKDCFSAAADVDKVYLGRPWRDYGYTLFMNCELPRQIRPEGWHHWREEAKKTARYLEYNNHGEGADTRQRVSWSRQLTAQEAKQVSLMRVFSINDTWEVTDGE